MEKLKRGIGAIVVIIGITTLVLVTVLGLFVQKRREALPTGLQTAKQKQSTTPTAIQIKPADATDTKLDKDFSDIDASMNAINVEGASIDAGLNDQMGDLSE